MTKGIIKIMYNNTMVQTLGVNAPDTQLYEVDVWKRLSNWWRSTDNSYGYDMLTLTLEDDSVLLLTRNQITYILLTPDTSITIDPYDI